ncbi:MAG: SIMPL domain-containing protein [Acidimicrobiales bacterium]
MAVQAEAGVPTPVAVPLGHTVTASAEGRAEGAPDLLTVSLGVQTRNHTAQGALADNSTKAQALIAKLKGDGVADKDIQTAQLQVNPEYTGGGPGVAPTVTGYVVNNIVTAKLRKLERAGSLIDDAVAAAGNDARVNTIGYSIDDDGALLANARADAVRQAQVRAKAMAQAAGVTLGPVRAITDVSQPQIQPMYFGAAGAAAGVANSSAPPLQPGTQRLTVSVLVVFDLA